MTRFGDVRRAGKVDGQSRSGTSLVLAILLLALAFALSARVAHAQAATRTTLAIPTDFALNMIEGSDGSLYSTSGAYNEGCQDNDNNQCSFIYKIAPDGTLSTFYAFQEVASAPGVFNTDGLEPTAFFEGADGNFYGACKAGGPGGLGTIFRISPDGTFHLIYAFPTTPYEGGQVPLNGAAPNSLIQGADGNLYGTSTIGTKVGVGNGGMLFQVTLDGVFTAVNYFPTIQDPVSGRYSYPEGGGPTSIVQGDNGDFFVSMNTGPGLQTSPPPNLGAIDQVTLSGQATVLFTFPAGGGDGVPSTAPLVEGSDRNFYGTTAITINNPNHYFNLAYQLSPAGIFKSLHQFSGGPDGIAISNGGLFLGSDLNFYGVTNYGGNNTEPNCIGAPTASGTGPAGCGTFFQLKPTGALTTLYSFSGGVSETPTSGLQTADGAHPVNPITQGPGGLFYGVTTGYGVAGVPVSDPTVYSLALTQPIPSPVQLSFSVKDLAVETVNPGTAVTVTWKVLNAFSLTAEQCHASVLGDALGAGDWSGPQTGSLKGNVYTGMGTITPMVPGTFIYVLNCGGVEMGSAKLIVSGVTILTAALQDGIVSMPYNGMLQASGGVLPYSWSPASPLPDGLQLASTGSQSTIELVGTPVQFGKYTIAVAVRDAVHSVGLKSFTFNIASGLTLVGALNDGKVGTAYNTFATATGGLPPYTWALASGKLPTGLTLNAGNGDITGKPTVAGIFNFSITAMDAEKETAATVTQAYTVSTLAPPLKIVAVTFPNCTVNVVCQGQFQATGGTPPYTWSTQANSPLPAGLMLASNGSFTGVPKQFNCMSGSAPIGSSAYLYVQVTDATSPTQLLDMTQTPLCIVSGLKIVSIPLPPATVGIPYDAPAPSASGGLPPYKWNIYFTQSPQLLDEYYEDPKTGILYSYVGAPISQGVFHPRYEVTDSEGTPASASMDATLTVNPLTITSVTTLSTSNSAAGVGMPVTLTATVTAKGSIPTGVVAFSNGNVLLGTATLNATGIGTFTTSFATAGSYSLTANYKGSGSIVGSVSSALTETVVMVGVMATINPSSLTIASGSSGMLTVTVTPMGGFTGTVTVSCGTLPAYVSCTYVPPSLTLTATGGPMIDTITIDTVASSATMVSSSSPGNFGTSLGLILWLPGSLAGVGVLFGRKRKPGSTRKLLLLAVGCLALAGAGTIAGCGGGQSHDAKPGTYTVPVTLTLAGGATQTVNATVIIQ